VTELALPADWLVLLSEKIRWMDNAMEDIQEMVIVHWKMCAQERDKCKTIVEQAKTHVEL
jgi:hypothetical protein